MSNYKLSNIVEEELCGLSPIQTIMKMAEKRNIIRMGLNPEEVISFGGGWCNHKAPEELRNIYKKIVEDEKLFHKTGRYSEILGEYNCREQICHFEKEIYNMPLLNAENIILGQSSTQLFHDLMRVLCNSSDSIGFLDPTYANYFNAVKSAVPGSNMVFIPGLETTNWNYLPNPDDTLEILKNYCEQGLKTLVIPIPDNPTSQIAHDDFLKSCLEILTDYNSFLVFDCAYKALWFKDMPNCFSWSPEKYPNLVLLNSNSKWLSSLGRRLGWIEADKKIIQGLEKLNESVLLSPDTMHSMATAKFLEKSLSDKSLKTFIDETRTLYEKTADTMIKNIDEYLGWSRLDPMGGLYTVCPTPSEEEPMSFVQRVLKNTGVLFIPGSGFGPSMQKAVRLSYGPLCYDHDLIQQGFERIQDYI
jgi:aspartate/methionine/tyrosine aminotransferase